MEITNLHQRILLCIQRFKEINLNNNIQIHIFSGAESGLNKAIQELEDGGYIKEESRSQMVFWTKPPAPEPPAPEPPPRFSITEKGASVLLSMEEIVDDSDLDECNKKFLKDRWGFDCAI